MRVHINTCLIGPDGAELTPGTIADLPTGFALELIYQGRAGTVDDPPAAVTMTTREVDVVTRDPGRAGKGRGSRG
jgi:hypothetical protein